MPNQRAKREKIDTTGPSRWSKRAALGAVLAVAASAIWLFTPRSQPPPPSLRGYNLLLLTIDTMRADALGADGVTPNLDRLAREGVKISSAFAHATTTLPSHASILTGEIPPRHGVRDNGVYRLDASRLTLAEILKEAGYRTGAFVGAFVLDSRFGLAQGFDRYDDELGESGGTHDFHFAERSAEVVLSRAEAWISESSEPPWFAWAHLFDPHVPYRPPAPFAQRFRDRPYYGEVAYVDHALGRFLEELRSDGRLEKTLVVLTSDHGESLGEHGELTHGAFAYDATLRVPLVFWSERLPPRADPRPASHVDVLPTVLDLLGIPVPGSVQGASMVASWGGLDSSDPPPIYFEALHGFVTQNLAPLTGVIHNGYKLIDLPLPELYHLERDPGEERNLVDEERDRVARLERERKRLVEDGALVQRAASLDDESRRKLQALGYLAPSPATAGKTFGPEDDPKNTIGLIRNRRAALALATSGRPQEAAALLKQVIEERPDFTVAYMDLAAILHDAGYVGEAIGVLERAPRRPWVLARLGTYLSRAGDSRRAVVFLEEALEASSERVDILNALGIAYAEMGMWEEAFDRLELALALDPSSAAVHNNLGTAWLRRREPAKAIDHFRRSVELDPDFAPAYEGLGDAHVASGDLTGAVGAWKKLLDLGSPTDDTVFNLGVALVELGRREEALPYLERFLHEAPPATRGADIEVVRRLLGDLRPRGD